VVSLIRTDDVPASRRREAWRQVVCDTLGPLDFRMDPDAPLSGDPGELAIYDFGRPYELDYRAAVQLAVFTFPRALLPISTGAVAGLTAIPLAGDHGPPPSCRSCCAASPWTWNPSRRPARPASRALCLTCLRPQFPNGCTKTLR
jgi:hypothetical protein